MSTDQTPDTGDGARDAMRQELHAQAALLEANTAAMARAAAHVDQVTAELATLRQTLTEAEASHQAEIGRLRESFDSACQTVAEMHAAAVGEVRGPIRGVVEDVADLRAERDRLRAELDEQDTELGRVIDEVETACSGLTAERDALAAQLDEAQRLIAELRAGIGRMLEDGITDAEERDTAEAERDALYAVYHAAKDVLDRNLLAGCGTAKAVLAEAVEAWQKTRTEGR